MTRWPALGQSRVDCSGHGPRLALRQERYLPVGSDADRRRQWQIPICARYAAAGAEKESCAVFSEGQGALPLEACPDWVIPNADASGYYRLTLPVAHLRQPTGAAYRKLD